MTAGGTETDDELSSDSDDRKYTVRDLIEALSKLDPNAPVLTEGCDCLGPWNGEVDIFKGDWPVRGEDAITVIICRKHD